MNKEKLALRDTMIFQRYELSRQLYIFYGKCLKELRMRDFAKECFNHARRIKQEQIEMLNW